MCPYGGMEDWHCTLLQRTSSAWLKLPCFSAILRQRSCLADSPTRSSGCGTSRRGCGAPCSAHSGKRFWPDSRSMRLQPRILREAATPRLIGQHRCQLVNRPHTIDSISKSSTDKRKRYGYTGKCAKLICSKCCGDLHEHTAGWMDAERERDTSCT